MCVDLMVSISFHERFASPRARSRRISWNGKCNTARLASVPLLGVIDSAAEFPESAFERTERRAHHEVFVTRTRNSLRELLGLLMAGPAPQSIIWEIV
jgi:hypothetical protein